MAVLSTLLYLLLTFFLLGLLIFVHELGHYLTARACGVTIHEFALGMGKRLCGFTSKKTGIQYSLRVFPVGGYVAMAGEDEEVDDPNAFNKKNVWQRMLILVAGASMNVLTGFLAMLILVGGMAVQNPKSLVSTTIGDFQVGATSYASGLEVGDEIRKVNGVAVHTGYDLSYEIMNSGYEAVDVVVERDGKILTVPDVVFPVATTQNIAVGQMDFQLMSLRPTAGNVISTAFYRSTSTVKMVFDSLGGIISGRYSIRDMSGPIGVSSAVSDVAKGPMPVWNMLYLFAVIAINLGVMNMLPIPALDGGRLFFRFVEVLRFGKPVKPDLEAKIHGVGMTLLLLLTAVIALKDVFNLF